jgi:DUF1365 family protein
MTSTAPAWLYEGRIVHERFTPRRHRFSYRAFLFAIDLDRVDEIAAAVRWVSRNRFNLFSFHDDDHVDRALIERLLHAWGVNEPIARIVLVTQLRMAGYVFNPVSFFYAFAGDGRPLGAVAEVNNTFGETKCYPLTQRCGDGFAAVHAKDFYISPFVARDSILDLRIGLPDSRLVVAMHDFEGERHVLTATMAMEERPLTSASLLLTALRHPLLTLRVTAAIHWEALRLLLKKIPWWRYA